MSIQSNFPNTKPSLLLDFSNTRQLDNRVTFTRSTPAVYYDGKTTAMAEQNLVLYSQNYAVGSWTLQEIVLSANSITAPDGTTTASTVSNNTGVNAYHRIYQAIPAFTQKTTYSFSLYLKYKDHQYVSFGLTDNNDYRSQVVVDLSNGTITQNYVSTAGDTLTSAITSVGNGWYRVTGTFTPNTAIAVNLYFLGTLQQGSTFTPNGYVGTGTGFYLWGIQAEQRNASTAYTATTTQPITNYIPVLLTAGGNQPRFDCNPTTGESLGLLIEEQRTNFQIYSLTGYAWASYLGATWISSSVVAPNGQIQGADVTLPSGSQMYSYVASFGSSGIAVTASAYMKYRSGANIVGIGVYDNTQGNRYVYFDLSNGTISSSDAGASGTITSVGNGWYRCTNTKTVQNATGGMTFYASNGACNIYTWGAQLEAGAFATSYIETTSASATRTADSAVMTGTNFSSWYNQGQGTIYAEGQINYNPIGGGGNSFYSIDDTSASKNVIQPYFSNGSGILFSFVNVNGVEQSNTGVTAISASTFFKHAQIYQTNNFASVVNNSTVSTDTSGITPVVTQLQFSNGKSKYFRKFAYYPLVVTTTQLQALTS